MKKLMIAACAVAFAAVTQASSFQWYTAEWEEVMLPASEDVVVPSATAYIFAASTTGSGATLLQSAIVDAFAAGTLDLTSGKLDFNSVSDGAIATKTAFDYGATGDNTQFYFALLAKDGEGNDMLYVSPEVTGKGYDSATEPMGFSNYEASIAAARDASGGYQGAGWYTAVPEPTSGLLLLLGVAGLALRRRRA